MMINNILILVAFLASVLMSAQELKDIRLDYPKAVTSIEITSKLDGELTKVTSTNMPTLLAYKGATLTLKAHFSKNRKDKKEFYKEGVSLIETAIKADSNNIEIRYIRLSVQENSPKFLGYHDNIEEDKKLIIADYSNIYSQDLKTVLKEFVLNSENFSDNEKVEIK